MSPDRCSRDLYRILHRVLGQLYDHNLGCGPAVDEPDLTLRVFNLEQELSRWHMSLDPRLTLQTPDSLVLPEDHDLRKAARCRTVLTLRYLHLQILLHRPFMVKALDMQARKTPQEQLSPSMAFMATTSLKNCVDNAENMISIIHTALSREGLGKAILGAWWYTLFYGQTSTLHLPHDT